MSAVFEHSRYAFTVHDRWELKGGELPAPPRLEGCRPWRLVSAQWDSNDLVACTWVCTEVEMRA